MNLSRHLSAMCQLHAAGEMGQEGQSLEEGVGTGVGSGSSLWSGVVSGGEGSGCDSGGGWVMGGGCGGEGRGGVADVARAAAPTLCDHSSRTGRGRMSETVCAGGEEGEEGADAEEGA